MPVEEQQPPEALPVGSAHQVFNDGQKGVDPQAEAAGILGEVGREAEGLSVALVLACYDGDTPTELRRLTLELTRVDGGRA